MIIIFIQKFKMESLPIHLYQHVRERNYNKLDEGVQEEQVIRQKYKTQIEAISNEYKDILQTAQQ